MPISRFLFFCSKIHSREAIGLLRRSGPPKRFQFCNYTKSSKNAKGKLDIEPVVPIQSQAPRSWGTYVIPAGVLGLVGLAALVHYNDERRVTLKENTPVFKIKIPIREFLESKVLELYKNFNGPGNTSRGNLVKGPIIGGPFTLADTENKIVTEKNLLGNWVLLYFGYTSSPDVGPEEVQVMAKAIDKLESRHNAKVLPVFVTIDPQRDTPAQLHAYLKEIDPRIVGLTGSVSAIRQMAQEYRVYFKKVEEEGDDYLIESSHNLYLMNPEMEVVRCFGIEYNADELSEAILKELKRTPIQ